MFEHSTFLRFDQRRFSMGIDLLEFLEHTRMGRLMLMPVMSVAMEKFSLGQSLLALCRSFGKESSFFD